MKELKGLVLDLPRQRSVINDPQVREARALWHKKCGPAKYQTTNDSLSSTSFSRVPLAGRQYAVALAQGRSQGHRWVAARCATSV